MSGKRVYQALAKKCILPCVSLRMLIVLLCCFFATSADCLPEWQLLTQDNHVAISVERSLYEMSGSTFFFTHIRVHNRTEKRLGLDLRDRSRVVYPNQWGVYPRPQREIIDEERRIPTRLTTELKKKLVDDFHSGTLTPLRDTIDYYVAFNSRRPQKKELMADHYLIVAMDGELTLTDGQFVEVLSLAETSDDKRELVISVPVKWKSVPLGKIVLAE
jgi:hypothetical protein